LELYIDGKKVYYEDKGSGDVLLLLHGWGSSHKAFSPIIDELSKYMRVIAPDLLGFGSSDALDSPWRVDDYVSFTEKLLNMLNINKLSVLGHSYGGRIIIKLASKPNSSVEFDKIVLVNAAGLRSRRSLKTRFRQLCFKTGKAIYSLPIIRSIYPDAIEELRSRYGSSDYKNATPVMRQTLVNSVNEDLTPLLSRITQPTLLIWGDKDTATPLAHAKIMEKHIADSGLVVFENAGHFSFLDKPYEFMLVLKSFFDITR
jgi:pimeloyl-ACP methyl ester carboxylesterase